ncbi:hypothetical protein OIU78_011883 [Salix suchowensis]|nr:hypothetical protein OIU78_011883 [Salix suchowensis]
MGPCENGCPKKVENEQRTQLALHVPKGLSQSSQLSPNLRAKISHFSLARAATRETRAAWTKHVVGDCRVSCNLLERGEVYACGVFLLELITWKDAALHRMEMKAYFQPQ